MSQPIRFVYCAACGDCIGWEPVDDERDSRLAGAEFTRSWTTCERCDPVPALHVDPIREELTDYGG